MDPNLTDVSFSLAKHVISANAKDANFVFSPLSIHVALGLIASGSDGPSRDNLLGFLKSESIDELNNCLSSLVSLVFAEYEQFGGPRLSLANGVWIDESLSLKPSFREIVDNVYKATSKQVDFRYKADEVREKVNKWAEKQTNGLIKNILGPGSVNNMTRLIFANAVYFKAKWANQFDPKCTKDDAFFLSNGSSIQVPFMASWGFSNASIGVHDGFKVLKLPYQSRFEMKQSLSMYFFLPDDRKGLPSLVERSCFELGFIDRHLPHEPVPLGRLQIPKFKIKFGFEASEVLRRQGVLVGGGLTEMVKEAGEDLFVSGILHESFIEVDEHGTEAAAVTVVSWPTASCCMDEPVDFVADHPFMFMIRENYSGVVLFIGQLFDPLAGGSVARKRKRENGRRNRNRKWQIEDTSK